MKKLIYGIFAASVMMLLSSCVVVTDKPEIVIPTPLFYSISFVNDSNENVIDWYVKAKGNDTPIAKSSTYCPVPAGQISTLDWLPRNNYYKVFFSLYPEYTTIYTTDGYFYLDSNVDFVLTTKSYQNRSAGSDESEKEYYLIGSDGSEIPLIKETAEPRVEL